MLEHAFSIFLSPSAHPRLYSARSLLITIDAKRHSFAANRSGPIILVKQYPYLDWQSLGAGAGG